MTCFAALAELEADTHLHIHKENNLLFPLVTRMEANCSEHADDDACRGGRRGGLLAASRSSPRSPDIGGRAHIERFVRDFYRQAAMDDVLGPVFAAAGMNWNKHIETLVEFWSWQLFGVRGYEGNPLRAHEPVHARTPFTA